MISPEHAERIRRRHERALAEEGTRSDRTFDHLGLTPVVPCPTCPARPSWRRSAPAGRMLIFFGTSGDLPYPRWPAREAGSRTRTAARRGLARDGWTVDCFTFRTTRPARTP
ncbi:hypothetical protein [Actinomadura kijaniata]|uniref:hypothetical protein n=1 Tax=Actinomadura kijaniata TaxID=46161 RepID=UPI00157CE04C|nr:hypothetical protein [Actinomadura kijaniata]